MNSELLAVIQTVLVEATKILGPAAIAAYVAYRSASVQFELQLKELEKAHQFQARSAIFTDLKERLAHIEQQTEKLNAELGNILGFASGFRIGSAKEEPNEVVDLMLRRAESAARVQPLETSVALADMRAAGLASSQEYAALLRRQDVTLPISGEATYDRLKTLIVELLETSHLLGVCTRLLLRNEMNRVFSPYLGSEK